MRGVSFKILVGLFVTVMSVVSCTGHPHGHDFTPHADSLFAAVSDMRYRDAVLLDSVSKELSLVAEDDNELHMVALNAMGYSALMRMDYKAAAGHYGRVLAESQCEIERLVADVGFMILYYRVSANRAFFDNRSSALARIKRIREDIDYLSPDDRERFERARIEFGIVSICYFSNLSMNDEKDVALSYLEENMDMADDMAVRLYSRMIVSNNLGDPMERLNSLATGTGIARNNGLRWLEGNYKLLLAISLRDTTLLHSFAAANPSRLEYLVPRGVSAEDIPYSLAMEAVGDFISFGDRYMAIEAMAVAASCDIQHERYYTALSLLDNALYEINNYYRMYYPDSVHLYSGSLHYLDNDAVYVTDISSGMYNIPECLLSVRREASCVYAAIGDKELSDINRDAYLELLRTTRMNKQLESRTFTAGNEAVELLWWLVVALVLLFATSLALYVMHRRRMRHEQMYSVDRRRMTDVCRKLISFLPEDVDSKEELCVSISDFLTDNMGDLSGTSCFSVAVDDNSALRYKYRFPIKYVNTSSVDILYVSTEKPLTPGMQALVEMTVPYIAVAVEEGLKLADISDGYEKAEELRKEYAIYLEEHKRENLLKRVSVSVVGAMRPFIDRIIREINELQGKQSSEDEERKLCYIAELTDKLDDLNTILERWIKMRRGELNLRIENFALNSLFTIVSKSSALYEPRGVALLVKESRGVVKADRALTLFMINTLVKNAAKFTLPGGNVTLESVEGEDFVEIAVTDTGIGLSPSDVETLSGEKVYDSSLIGADNELLQPKSKGNGFGLMNCKGIIEKYRKTDSLFSVCSFDIKSVKGKGSRFSFRLPKGIVRTIAVLSLLLPHSLFASDALFSEVRYHADSVYMSNVAHNFDDAFVQAQQALELLNIYYREQTGGNDTLTLLQGNAAELRWWREELFPDSLLEKVFYNVLDIRNEVAVASLAKLQWGAYRYNNGIYTTLYRLVHEDKGIADKYDRMAQIVNMRQAAIALSCFVLLVLLLYGIISYVRHNIIERQNERMILDANSRLLSVASAVGRMSEQELAQALLHELYDSLGESMRMRSAAMLLRHSSDAPPVLVEEPVPMLHGRADIYMQSMMESGEPYVSSDRMLRVCPLFVSRGRERMQTGVIEVVTERPLSENEESILELVSGYMASVAYHSIERVVKGYMAIEEAEEAAASVKYEENRLHVQNQVMDNCLSVIKHETVYYPSRIRELAAKAVAEPAARGEAIVGMKELMDYYNSIFGILSNCARRELDEMSFSLKRIELNKLFSDMQSYLSRRASRAGCDIVLEYESADIEVNVDVSLVSLLIESLLDAALKTKLPGCLRLSAVDAGDMVRVELFDSRVVLTSEEVASLFTPDKRNIADDGTVWGMEYLVAKEIVRMHEDYTGSHGGRMEARSDVSGTVILFTLPK